MIVAKDTSGRAVNGTATATDLVLGVSKEQADNSSGADNAIKVPIARGIWCFGNSAWAIDRREIRLLFAVVDNQTVAKTDNSARPAAEGPRRRPRRRLGRLRLIARPALPPNN